MEFSEKLQELRKSRSLTQEELAEALYVSRTAVSKWESGRGYPSIDSLKEISRFFSVKIDDLICPDEIITAAENEKKVFISKYLSVICSALDVLMAVLLFIPAFGNGTDSAATVPLSAVTGVSPWIKIVFIIIISVLVLNGIFGMILSRFDKPVWNRHRIVTGMVLSIIGAVVFIVTRQPYAGIICFALLVIKGGLLLLVNGSKQAVLTMLSMIMLAMCLMTGCGAKPERTITSFSDLEEKRIGVTTGSIQALQTEERFPNAEIHYFSADADMLEAMRKSKIDAYASAEALAKYMMAENPDLTCLDEYLSTGIQAGAVFPKTDSGRKLCDEFSSFVREIRENGVYDEIQDTWFGEDEARRAVPDLYSLSAENGTLRMAADVTMVPFVFIKDGDPVGIDVDTVVRFCKEYGYGLEIIPMDFAAIIPAVVTGKADFACSGVAYTPERAESLFYSEFTYEGGSVIAVLKSSETAAGNGFFASVRESFRKTFIREDRWKMFLSGIATTVLITVLSALFGTILGFCVFMLCRNGNPAANKITRFFVWLIRGMPAVVLLMILYYIIFGNVAIPGTAVSVIGFTLVFGAGVYGMVSSGVGAIDKGQLEAAYALGYSDRRAFFRVILPQALPHFMPAYKGSITELIKATAIVGYVAVQDLTKIGDIIRSRTYEAFFPLIAVAVIYFILAAVLTAVVNRLGTRLDPRSRKREDILKGVHTE